MWFPWLVKILAAIFALLFAIGKHNHYTSHTPQNAGTSGAVNAVGVIVIWYAVFAL